MSGAPEAEHFFALGVRLLGGATASDDGTAALFGAAQSVAEAAADAFQKAAALAPAAAPIAFNVAAALARAGAQRSSEVVSWLQRAVRLAPRDAGTATALAQALEGASRMEEAVEAYAQASRLAPLDARLLVRRGIIVERHRGVTGLAEASSLFESALSLQPQDGEAWYNSAVVAEKTARGQDAVERYRVAVSLAPFFPDTHHRLGLSLQRLGRQEEALGAHAVASRITGSSGDAVPMLAAIEVARIAGAARMRDAETRWLQGGRGGPAFVSILHAALRLSLGDAAGAGEALRRAAGPGGRGADMADVVTKAAGNSSWLDLYGAALVKATVGPFDRYSDKCLLAGALEAAQARRLAPSTVVVGAGEVPPAACPRRLLKPCSGSNSEAIKLLDSCDGRRHAHPFAGPALQLPHVSQLLLEQPLRIRCRKVDFRIYVLIVHPPGATSPSAFLANAVNARVARTPAACVRGTGRHNESAQPATIPDAAPKIAELSLLTSGTAHSSKQLLDARLLAHWPPRVHRQIKLSLHRLAAEAVGALLCAGQLQEAQLRARTLSSLWKLYGLDVLFAPKNQRAARNGAPANVDAKLLEVNYGPGMVGAKPVVLAPAIRALAALLQNCSRRSSISRVTARSSSFWRIPLRGFFVPLPRRAWGCASTRAAGVARSEDGDGGARRQSRSHRHMSDTAWCQASSARLFRPYAAWRSQPIDVAAFTWAAAAGAASAAGTGSAAVAGPSAEQRLRIALRAAREVETVRALICGDGSWGAGLSG